MGRGRGVWDFEEKKREGGGKKIVEFDLGGRRDKLRRVSRQWMND